MNKYVSASEWADLANDYLKTERRNTVSHTKRNNLFFNILRSVERI